MAGAFDLVSETGVTYPLLADPQSALQGAAPVSRPDAGCRSSRSSTTQGRATVVAVGIESLDELVDLVDEHLGVEL